MTKQELLTTYRSALLELEEIEAQLSRIGTDGRPAGLRGGTAGMRLPGTNHPAAAAWQTADGLEKMVEHKRAELTALSAQLGEVMGSIGNARTFMIVQHYYLMAETDETIGQLLHLSTSRINQLRRSFMQAA
ncbi:MAG: hypothetical protein IJ438_10500 [Clostridia bacterium]|nr:hypothetical protein [Clostridia bacterium]